jgi:heptosyltransferase III
MLNNCRRILLVRTDKIGDLVLTTPALLALKEKNPDAEIDFLVAEGPHEILIGHPALREVLVLDPEQYSGVLGFFRLRRRIARQKYDAVIVFQAKAFIGFALLFAGIAYRTGPLSKWWSWICWNFGRRQTRSAVEMHEAEYNIQLLRDFGITVAKTRKPTSIALSDASREYGQEYFRTKSIRSRFKTVVIHAGMAGSALNWPEQNYIDLGRRLVTRFNVIVTGGAGEEILVNRLMQSMGQEQSFFPDQPVLTKYIGNEGLGKFLGILSAVDAVVAPSTGPMHLAIALGKKVVTIFPPIKVQSALRWGPYGVSFGTSLGVMPQDQASVLVPDVNCAENFKCAMEACMYYPCMPRISVDSVETQLIAILGGVGVSMVKGSAFLTSQVDLGLGD